MNVYVYRTWGGTDRIVHADYAVFEPGHVVFYRVQTETAQPFLVLAEANNNVNGLVQVEDEQ